ncbi:MAG: leucyl/phenylalanyl-tRNA--protein transferase, partial [Pseudomonadales bacterium]|nr:leucyl/phenylalanyl-tRNA--protein transferase [Pseudomonadales bacterium]
IDAALEDPNGLLAVGGELSVERLLTAYRQGIFPWSEASQPILWWSPNPRAVIEPQNVYVSRSLRKSMRRDNYALRINTAFDAVIRACAGTRDNEQGTWITAAMIEAYCELNRLGHAHSLEVWHKQELVGGLYGVAVGKLFCGESMFYRRRDASKIAFVALCYLLAQQQWPLIDCQVLNPHLQSLGVTTVSRNEFKAYLPAANCPGTKKHPGSNNDPMRMPDWQSLPFRNSAELEQMLP